MMFKALQFQFEGYVYISIVKFLCKSDAKVSKFYVKVPFNSELKAGCNVWCQVIFKSVMLKFLSVFSLGVPFQFWFKCVCLDLRVYACC